MSTSPTTTARTRQASWLLRMRSMRAHWVLAPARTLKGALARQTATTPGSLRILSVLIVFLTAMVWVSAVTIVSSAHRTVTAMTEETAPAVIAAGRAQAFLAKADAAHAHNSMGNRTGAAPPGQAYLSSRKSGAKELGQALASNTAGSAGASLLRSAERGLSGYARLPFASHFMHNPTNSILHKIGRVRALNRNTFLEQRSSVWLSPVSLVLYLIPAAALLLLLLRTQLFLRRRFRRRVNLPLLVATGLLIVLSGWTIGQVWHTHSALERGGRSLNRVTNLLQARTLVAEADAAELHALSSTPDRWLGRRLEHLAHTPLTEPVIPPVGDNQTIGDVTTEEVDVAATLAKWNVAGEEGRHVVAEARKDFREFTHTDRTLDETVKRSETQLETVSQRLHDRAVELDGSLSQLTAVERERFNASMRSAAAQLGLGVGIPMLTLGIFVFTLGGLAPRLNEYHGWQGGG